MSQRAKTTPLSETEKLIILEGGQGGGWSGWEIERPRKFWRAGTEGGGRRRLAAGENPGNNHPTLSLYPPNLKNRHTTVVFQNFPCVRRPQFDSVAPFLDMKFWAPSEARLLGGRSLEGWAESSPKKNCCQRPDLAHFGLEIRLSKRDNRTSPR